ncbi:diacylglycerol/lipid kinase family protein, partial [Agromyces soli]
GGGAAGSGGVGGRGVCPDRAGRGGAARYTAGAAAPARTLPRSRDGEGVLVVANPSAGGGAVGGDPLRRLEARLPRAQVRRLAADQDPAEVVAAALRSEHPPRIVGVCGGDGTIAAVAGVAREAGLPLLVVPGGTFNHFARAVGVATVDLAVDALQHGEGVRVDVAELRLGGQAPVTVLNTASLGVHPDFVAVRERLEGRMGRRPAALVAAVRVLRRADPVRIELDGRVLDVWALFVGVGRYDAGAAPLQRTRLDEGVLDVRLLRAGSRTRAAASLVFGRGTGSGGPRPSRRVETSAARRLEVVVRRRPGGVPGFAHDGEVALDEMAAADAAGPTSGYRATVTIVPAALDVYRPAAP